MHPAAAAAAAAAALGPSAESTYTAGNTTFSISVSGFSGITSRRLETLPSQDTGIKAKAEPEDLFCSQLY